MTDGLSESTTQLDTTPDQVVETADLLVTKAEALGFKKADVTLIKAKYATDTDAQALLTAGVGEGSKDVYETFLQPFLVLKEVFGQDFFDKAIGIYTNYQIPYNQLQQAAKDLAEYRKQLEAGIFNVTMDDAHALLHTLQSSGTIKEFFDKQKKETIHFTDDRLQVGASPGEKKSYTDFFVGRQDAYTAEFAKLIPVEQFAQFSPDVRDNMSAGVLHRWIAKVDAYVAAHADKKFDKIDLNELWRVSPFSAKGKEISGVDMSAFVTALGTVAVPEGAKLDECTQLMDPVKFTSLVNGYATTQKVTLTEFLPTGSRYEFATAPLVLTKLQRVASIMKAAPEASAGKTMVASVKPILKDAGEQMKGVAEMLKGFMDELKASGVLEQIKELFATWSELTASFDVTKMLETEKGDPQKLVAVQLVLDQIKPGLQNMEYTPQNFSKVGGIKEHIQKIDPVKAEGPIRQSLGDEGYKKLFLDSTIVDSTTLPKGNGLRILMMSKMMTALAYTPAQREEAMKDANQSTAYTKMLGEYADKKHAERTETAGRKFNDKSDGAVVEQGGERFARSLISSILLDETKAKIDYSAQPKIETKEGADEINHLDGVEYHVDADKKLHIDKLPGKMEKLAVKINGVLTEITPTELATKTIDLSAIVAPVTIDLVQWSPAKKTWSETNKLDAVEIDMDMHLTKKSDSTLTLAGLDVAGAYETKLLYTKEGQTKEIAGTIDVGSTTKDISVDAQYGTATHVLVRKKEPISPKQLPWQKVLLPVATEVKK